MAGNPLPRRFVLWMFLCLGIAFLFIGVGTAISLWYAHHNGQLIETRGAARNAQQAETQRRLDDLTAQLAVVVNDLKRTQDQGNAAICGLVISSVQKDRAAGKTIDPLTFQFAANYGCHLPPAAPPPH